MHPEFPDPQDRHAIEELLSRYCHAMDAARGDLCISLFTDDASLDTPVGQASGRDEILAWIEDRLAQRSPDYQVAHYMLHPLIALQGRDEAIVRSMLLYTRQHREKLGAAELLSTGIYEDRVRRTADGWRFTTRNYALSLPLNNDYFPESTP